MHFFSLKTNKTPGYDNLIVDIIEKIVDEIQRIQLIFLGYR